jgi:DDE superfamily endonuclease
MVLWTEIARCLSLLRPCVSRHLTFCWMSLLLATLCLRRDLAGVTSCVRAGWLQPRLYRRMLHVFHSDAVDLTRLTSAWIGLVLRLFAPVRVGSSIVLLADGTQVAKEGRKMPAVKSLFDHSHNSSAKPFFMGHAFQTLAALVHAGKTVVAVPLTSRLSEGIVPCSLHKPTRLEKFIALFHTVAPLCDSAVLLVADSYYASQHVIRPLLEAGHHLVSRTRRTTCGYLPAQPSSVPRRRGRPRVYGEKRALTPMFAERDHFHPIPSPVYGESGVTILVRVEDLLWKPLGMLVRFVLVIHPTRGNIILLSTDTSLDATTVVRLYGYRFKIETGFRAAKTTLGSYAYHFWCQVMDPIRTASGDQYLHRKTAEYRAAIHRKIGAYHRWVQFACIAQGLLLHLSVNFRVQVWHSCKTWLRTMHPDLPPSEFIVTEALKTDFVDFLLFSPLDNFLRKMFVDHSDQDTRPLWLNTA